VNGSISIQKSSALSKNSIGIFRRNVIPESDIPELYHIALILEEWEKPIKWGKKFQAQARMVMYGIF